MELFVVMKISKGVKANVFKLATVIPLGSHVLFEQNFG